MNMQETITNGTPVREEVPIETIEQAAVEKEAMKEASTFVEEIETTGNQLVARVKELIAEGNARRLLIRSPNDRVMLEVPLTAGVIVGGVVTIAAPFAAALTVLAALFARMKIQVIRDEEEM